MTLLIGNVYLTFSAYIFIIIRNNKFRKFTSEKNKKKKITEMVD